MDLLKRKKTSERSAFTKYLNNLDALLQDDSVTYDNLELAFCLFKQKDENLEKTHMNYLDSLTDEKEYETEFEAVESYREKAIEVKLKAKKALDQLKEQSNSGNAMDNSNNYLDSSHNLVSGEDLFKIQQRLPKIELKKFNGDLKEWLTFWNQFQKIHENKSLTDSEKLHYLIQSTESKSEPRELIESFPVTDENYPLAVQSLIERYGREDVLIEVYVRDLLSLILSNATERKQKCSLNSLYNKLSTQLRALSSLGVTSDKCAVILYPLVESCLPLDILRMWERQRPKVKTDTSNVVDKKESWSSSDLDALLVFLKSEVESEQRILLSRSDFINPNIKNNMLTQPKNSKAQSVRTAAELLNQESEKRLICVFCGQNHETRFCKKAFSMPLDEKTTIIKRNGLCLVCLYKGHLAKSCKSKVKCACSKRHLKIMCPSLEQHKVVETSENIVTDSNKINDVKTVESLHSQSVSNGEVFLQTLVVKILGPNCKKFIRAVLDTGSQRSYILRSTAIELGYESQGEQVFSHSLFGGAKTKEYKHHCYKIQLENLNGKYKCELDALDQDLICNDIPSVTNGPWINELKLKKIDISDVGQRFSGPIEVLLGADVAGKLFTSRKEVLKTGQVAMETKLGWTLMGKVPTSNSQDKVSMFSVSLFAQGSASISNLWDLDLIGIRDPVEQRSREETKEAVILHFQETVHTNEEGRYEVNMPWKIDHVPLPDNYDVALKRLTSTRKKLKRDGYLDEYQQVFDEWQNERIIEVVPDAELTSGRHYLPHRPVIKNSSTTKVRPVFDASAKVQNGTSLNDCLETGVNLIETIPSILSGFRKYKIGVISDIKKAFLQISVQQRDRDFLRFLWCDDRGNLKVFRHTRVVFGVTSSPFLLGAVIEHHLSKESSRLPDNSFTKIVIEKLKGSFYVDNCVTSINEKSNLEPFIKEATEIMKRGKFDLRGWEDNTSKPCIVQSPIKVNVLGLVWDKQADCLEINSEDLQFNELETVTKRNILSLVNKVFDPMGYISPVMLPPKLILQSLWKNKEPWDTEVKTEIRNAFLKWTRELPHLKNIKIPRWIGASHMSIISLHTFCDASQNAYAAAIFVRCELGNDVTVQLLQAKSRISPLKHITIPRMELLSATIGARLYITTKKSLKLNISQSFFWTDSSTVLSWIQRQDQWSVFVNNRVTEIRNLTSSKDWFHIAGNQNPADLPSRGCGAKKLSESRWLEGPEWLKMPQDLWPRSSVNVNEKEIEAEKKRTVVSAKTTVVESVVKRLSERVSKFSKLVRIIAWILRFQPKARNLRNNENIAQEEYSNALKTLLRGVQSDSFFDDTSRNPLKKFQVYTDSEGLLRMKSRLTEEDETKEFIFPIILPSRHPVVVKMIEQEHIIHKHAGALTLLTILRQKFWILKGRKTVASVIRKCIVCKRYQTKSLRAPFPPLPKDRTNLLHTFQVTGVDLAGPLLVKTGEKFWVVIFTCGVYRAVHLELVPSLSTPAFIQAVRRFIARRGRVCTFYSDNGTNFAGLSNAMKRLNWDQIQKEFEVRQIQWKFNPPTAPWWGGFWERLIRILKDLLRKNLGRASLNFQELFTLICECESIMNNRPLSYVAEDDELRTLTPSMFLQSLVGNEVPDLDAIEETNLHKRWRYVQRLRENLKQRFKTEYLGFLRSSCGNVIDSIKVGDVVLIGSDDKKRLDWPLARVEELFLGRDNIPRLVKVKTAKGSLLRPIQRLYPLELQEKERVPICEGHRSFSPDERLFPDAAASTSSVPIKNFPNGHSFSDDVVSNSSVPVKNMPIGQSFYYDTASKNDVSIKTRSGRIVKPPKRLDM